MVYAIGNKHKDIVYVFVLGEGVDHFHAHVIARYKNAPKEYWGPKVDEWPDAPRGTTYHIWSLDDKIMKELKILIYGYNTL